MNSKKNVIQFYTHLFKDLKDLSRMLLNGMSKVSAFTAYGSNLLKVPVKFIQFSLNQIDRKELRDLNLPSKSFFIS